MTPSVSLGAVDYLNARPLVYGIGPRPQATGPSDRGGSASLEPWTLGPGPDLSVRFDLPAVCANLLDAGEIDLGLVPTIAYFDRQDFQVVPGIGVVSAGPVASVAVFARRPIAQVRSLALDTSSRTSVALTRILFARVFETRPACAAHRPDLGAMLEAHDAALLIGDPALFADYESLGAQKVDLGQTWTDWTGLPFVWAFWAGRPEVADAGVVSRLQAVRDAGVAASDAIADEYCRGDAARQAIARRYLRENIQYVMSDAALDGLNRFYREAAELGLIERAGPVRFY